MSVESLLANFESLGLDEMNRQASLLHRFDTKFLIHEKYVPGLLAKCVQDFRILEIQNQRIFPYETTYFDTADFRMYADNHRGKLPRQKIRIRNYPLQQEMYAEVKNKTRQGHSHKLRKRIISAAESMDFFENNSAFSETALAQKLMIRYQRISLLDASGHTKITFDLNLEFLSGNVLKNQPGLAIVEVKSVTEKSVPFLKEMFRLGVRPGGISKYCLGLQQFYPELKKNLFLPALQKINTIMAYE